MTPTVVRSGFRHALRHPWQLGLALLGIAVGVAVVVSVDLSVESARRAFALSTEAVLGRADHQIVGGPGGVPESVYPVLKRRFPELAAAPVVVGHVVAGGAPGRGLTILGVDPFAEAPFRPYVPRAGERGLLAGLLTRPGAVLASRATAAALGVRRGDPLALRVGSRALTAHLAGLLRPADALQAGALSDLLIADVSTAQELLDRVGYLSRIDLVVGHGRAAARELAAIRAVLPPGLEVVATGPRWQAARDLTRAFDLNLRMLSLLALVVGMFLIYNTMTFSVVQRRALIGNLRALGVTRREVLGLFLLEAGILGLVGTALGLAGGIGLAELLLRLVVRTVNDLYFRVHVAGVSVSALALAKAGLLGVGASVVAALHPARAAARVPPRAALSRSALEARTRRGVPRAALAGAVTAIGAVVLLAIPGGIGLGFVGLFALMGAFALVAPGATVVLAGAAHAIAARFGGVLGPMGTRGITANLSRTAVAVAALMVAVSATVGMGVMVESFRGTVAAWLQTTLRADLYVGTPGAGPRPPLDPGLVRRVEHLPGVAHVSAGRKVELESDVGPVDVLVLRMAPESYAGFQIVQGGAPRRVWAAYDARDAVLVSEPFAARHDLGPGARLALLTDAGRRDFEVAGVFRDYGSEQGLVLMSRRTWERHWRDRAYTTLGVYARPGVDRTGLRERIIAAVPPGSGVAVRDNASIRKASLAVFDRTFAITRVLRLLAIAVAFVGILSALMAIQLEREKEVAVLRALGLLPVQVWGVVQAQTGVLGIIAGLLSLPLGLAIALVLVDVINRRSFGWSMDLHVDPWILVQGVGIALLAALAAGAYPAWRMARTAPALALREE